MGKHTVNSLITMRIVLRRSAGGTGRRNWLRKTVHRLRLWRRRWMICYSLKCTVIIVCRQGFTGGRRGLVLPVFVVHTSPDRDRVTAKGFVIEPKLYRFLTPIVRIRSARRWDRRFRGLRFFLGGKLCWWFYQFVFQLGLAGKFHANTWILKFIFDKIPE